MFRGYCHFICDDCGHAFEGMDIELACTSATAPATCPKCGSHHTYPKGSNRENYKPIWNYNAW